MKSPLLFLKVSRKAFTLVELLVVITIVAILAGLLVTVVGKVKERGNATATASNMRQLGTAFLLFAGEHDGYLPGNFDTRDKVDPNGGFMADWQSSWLSGVNQDPNEVSDKTPEKGTIWPYVKTAKVYRAVGLPEKPSGEGGSNGKFDFAMMLRLGGAKLINIPGKCKLRDVEYPTPLLIQESPDRYLNGQYREGAHGFTDEAAQHYANGCYYVAIDGSTHYLKVPINSPYQAKEWAAVGPVSGNYVSLGQPNLDNFGDWNTELNAVTVP